MTLQDLPTDFRDHPTGFNAVVSAKYGYMIYNRHDCYVGKSIEMYGEYSEGEVAIFRQFCREGDTVVEAGANIGAHTLPLSRMLGVTGRIHAFEPQRMVFQTLCGNMAINSITNAHCHNMALSSENGHIYLPDADYEQLSNFGGFELSSQHTGKNKVPVATLDSVLDLADMRLLKIDVEGMEHEVIEGARGLIDTHKPILYVENDRADKSKRLIELIQSFDYRLFWHLPLLFNPHNFAGKTEDIFSGIGSCNMLCAHRSFQLNIIGANEITDSDPRLHPSHRLGNIRTSP